MKEVTLDKGMVALVDDGDYAVILSCGAWHAAYRGGSRWYARAGSGSHKNRYMHSLLTGFRITDHINHNGLDNQRHNLRPATQPQNNANELVSKNNKSGYKGVTWDTRRGKWYASIMVNGQTLSLGRHAELEDAVAVRIAAEERYQGEYAFNPLARSINA